MKAEIILSDDHVRLLKQHRFHSAWRRSADDYLEKQDIGWLKPGLKMAFAASIDLEPYAAIYHGTYVSSTGGRNAHGLCSMGSYSYSHSALPERMQVGRFCSLSSRIRVLDIHHPLDRLTTGHASYMFNSLLQLAMRDRSFPEMKNPEKWNPTKGLAYPVIGHDVWIGQDAVLSLGITVGQGAVIAANALVTKDVPPYAIVGGNPAKIIRFRFGESIVERLLASHWCDYDWLDFSDIGMRKVEEFLDRFEERQPELTRPVPNILRLPDAFMMAAGAEGR